MQLIPEHLYRDVYSTLFEIYLTYGISVWGAWAASGKKLEKLFTTQKKVVLVLFGNKEKFIDKSKACARTRPFQEQGLISEFYEKEPKNYILNLKNLYFYYWSI